MLNWTNTGCAKINATKIQAQPIRLELRTGVEEPIIFRSMCIWARLSLVLPKQWRFEKNMLFFICTKIDVKAISANFVCSACSRIRSLFAAKYEWNDVSMKSFHYSKPLCFSDVNAFIQPSLSFSSISFLFL